MSRFESPAGVKLCGSGRSMIMITGVPTAAAMCAGPVSFEMKTVSRAWAEINCGIVKRSKKIVPDGNSLRICDTIALSSGPAKTITRTLSFLIKWSASSTKRSSGQRRVLLPAPGKIPTSSSRAWAFSFFSSASTATSSAGPVLSAGARETFSIPSGLSSSR